MTETELPWRKKPWIHEDLPLWKRLFKVPARLFMVLIYYGLIIGGIIALVLLESVLRTPGYTYDFFGIYLPVTTIVIIASVVIFGIGIYGSIISTKMILKYLQKKPFKLTRLPKITILSIIIIAFAGVSYYMPQWPLELGLTEPTFGPYIAYHGENAMMISWDTPKDQKSTLYWGTKNDDLSNKITAKEYYWKENEISRHHIAIIENLIPGQKYYYKVPDVSDEVYSFKAAPSPTSGEAVTFMMVADTQGGYHVQRRNINLMLEKTNKFDFMCIAGDLCNRDDSLSEWAMLFNDNSYGRVAATTPWMNSPGNHETYCDEESCGFREHYKTYFQYKYPNNHKITDGMPDYGLYYSYNYSNVHMIALDVINNATLDTYFSTAQLEWLENDLANNQDMWKIVYLHYPMYSMGDFMSTVPMAKILEPIFFKYEVDAVFYGHDHHFESFLVNGTASYGGTYHFNVGGGGGTIDPMTNVDKYGTRAWPDTTIQVSKSDGRFDNIYGHEYELMGEMTHHFMIVEINGDQATFTAIRSSDGSKIVSYNVIR